MEILERAIKMIGELEWYVDNHFLVEKSESDQKYIKSRMKEVQLLNQILTDSRLNWYSSLVYRADILIFKYKMKGYIFQKEGGWNYEICKD